MLAELGGAGRRRCARPTGARTSSSRRSRTSCAIRSRRCATRSRSCARATIRPGDARRDAREMMERQLQQMVRLVDDLLDVSRITTGKLALRRAPLDLREVAARRGRDRAAASSRRAPRAGAVAWPTPVWLDGDRTRLAQVFSNLLNNAAQVHRAGRPHRDHAARSRATRRWCASSTTASASRPRSSPNGLRDVRAGRPVARARAGRPRRRPDAGAQLVELHGGTIDVAQRRRSARAASFTVRLPRLAGRAGAAAAAPTPAAPGAERRHALRILVADDNVDFADSLAALLERRRPRRATCLRRRRRRCEPARAFVPTSAFLDIGMPETERLRARRGACAPSAGGDELLLVAVTGWGQESDRQRARAPASTATSSSRSTPTRCSSCSSSAPLKSRPRAPESPARSPPRRG